MTAVRVGQILHIAQTPCDVRVVHNLEDLNASKPQPMLSRLRRICMGTTPKQGASLLPPRCRC